MFKGQRRFVMSHRSPQGACSSKDSTQATCTAVCNRHRLYAGVTTMFYFTLASLSVPSLTQATVFTEQEEEEGKLRVSIGCSAISKLAQQAKKQVKSLFILQGFHTFSPDLLRHFFQGSSLNGTPCIFLCVLHVQRVFCGNVAFLLVCVPPFLPPLLSNWCFLFFFPFMWPEEDGRGSCNPATNHTMGHGEFEEWRLFLSSFLAFSSC